MPTTITAVATGGMRAPVAIIRVSGPKSLEVFQNLAQNHQIPLANQLKPTWIYNDKGKIDHVMMVYFKSPHSFTGEDMLEIHCHGSEAIIKQVLDQLLKLGVEPAKPGEFSERAYRNNKIDLFQAEAIMELIASENTQTAKLATRQLAGEFSQQINSIKSSLTMLNAKISADIDFSEEDTPSISKEKIQAKLQEVNNNIQTLSRNSELLPKLKNGIHVALVGLPNAGKSTLLNTILGFERSIVTSIAGTTRDTVSENVEIQGINYNFIDTAGLNNQPDVVEKLGIEKSIQTINSANIILLLVEVGKLAKTKEFLLKNNLNKVLDDPRTILVYTKSDIDKPSKNQFAISAKNKSGIKELLDKIASLSKIQSTEEINILTERQNKLILQVQTMIVNILNNIVLLSNDIISAELEASIDLLNELTGEQANQQIIDSIFRSFCIGK